jgi:peptidoglycan hydrolase-like protein with peptidoglycan-binding domain
VDLATLHEFSVDLATLHGLYTVEPYTRPEASKMTRKTLAVVALLTVPALASAQAGLSRIQFLALQQELRDQGCGVTNVDGRYGPQTRRAIATCAQKFNSANNAAALLAAMNIGFGPGDTPPTGTTPTSGE